MKKYLLMMIAAMVSFAFASCSEDELNDKSIFSGEAVERDLLDQWLYENYTLPYSISFKYKMEDIETNYQYNLIPADSAKSAKIAKIVKFLWMDAYAETVGTDFVKSNCPRIILLVGSRAYNSDGTFVMGTAEGGYKVTLYMVNELTDEVLGDYATLNDYYFHTMHHEFTHILNQKTPYDTSFDQITESGYKSGDWYNVTDHNAHIAGFVTPYAMSEGREDFAEMMACYVTMTAKDWEAILEDAGDTKLSESLTARQAIEQKLQIVRNYMQSSWGLDIDDLRYAVLHRASDLKKLDLNHLN